VIDAAPSAVPAILPTKRDRRCLAGAVVRRAGDRLGAGPGAPAARLLDPVRGAAAEVVAAGAGAEALGAGHQGEGGSRRGGQLRVEVVRSGRIEDDRADALAARALDVDPAAIRAEVGDGAPALAFGAFDLFDVRQRVGDGEQALWVGDLDSRDVMVSSQLLNRSGRRGSANRHIRMIYNSHTIIAMIRQRIVDI
jgi:hypothetical protein